MNKLEKLRPYFAFSWIKIILFCSVSYTCLNLSAQDYGKKEFYLVDSLDLTSLEKSDRILLDSILTDFHNNVDSINRIENFFFFTDNATNFKLCQAYNNLAVSLLEQKVAEGNHSPIHDKKYRSYLARSYCNQSYYEQHVGHYTAAIDLCRKAEEFQLTPGEELNLAITYNNLAGVYYKLNQLDSAYYYFNSALKIEEKLADSPEILRVTLGNIAVIAEKMGNEEKAIEIHEKLILLCLENGDMLGASRSFHNIGTTFLNMKDYEQSLDYLKKAHPIFLEQENFLWLSYNYISISQVYNEQGDLDGALENAIKADTYAVKSNAMRPLMLSSKLLYKLYKEKGKYDLALSFYETFHTINDSLSGIDLQVKNAKKDLEFEFAQTQLQLENEMNHKLEIAEIDKKQKTLIYNGILILMLIVLTFAIIFFYRMRVISAQKKIIEAQNSERKTLLKEIHHRVKNNFQIVISILRLQSNQEENPLVERSFQDAIARIHSMSAVHELIYKNEIFTEINPKKYFLKLTESMRSYTVDDSIEFVVKSDIESLDLETLVPLGIAVNELITNSIKYAFNESITAPKVEIELTMKGDEKVLTYKDNGIGITVDKMPDTFGIELIETIIEKIDGVLHTEKLLAGSGTRFKFSFK